MLNVTAILCRGCWRTRRDEAPCSNGHDLRFSPEGCWVQFPPGSLVARVLLPFKEGKSALTWVRLF